MKTIALLRHAKSDWDVGTTSDFDRPLSPRGRQAASAMGRYIERECLEFDRILVSSARRCRETCEMVYAELDNLPEIAFEEHIYLASAGNLLELVQAQDDALDRLLIIGHNPGLTYLALDLIRQDEGPQERERIAEKFPTAAFVQLECAVTRWADLGTAACRLEKRRYPAEEVI